MHAAVYVVYMSDLLVTDNDVYALCTVTFLHIHRIDWVFLFFFVIRILGLTGYFCVFYIRLCLQCDVKQWNIKNAVLLFILVTVCHKVTCSKCLQTIYMKNVYKRFL